MYVPQPHGVDLYFAKIKDHRNTLSTLFKPKHIAEWEVVAKTLQDLPPLHPKFEAGSRLLELQRQMLQQETTLAECIKALSNAETGNMIWKDLQKRSTRTIHQPAFAQLAPPPVQPWQLRAAPPTARATSQHYAPSLASRPTLSSPAPTSVQQQTTRFPLRTQVANLQNSPALPVSKADLIAAGMQYFNHQSDNQDFRFG